MSAQAQSLMEEINILSEVLRTCCDTFSQFYETSRDAYVSFVTFAPTVQSHMQDIDKWHAQYEMRRQQTLEDFEEIERLRTWYEYFQKSYVSMEAEIARRRIFEVELAKKAEAMRLYLSSELQKEQQLRISFNE